MGIVTIVALSIPSPSSNQLELGPLTIRYYGLMIAIGAVLSIYVAGQRWLAMGGSQDDVSAVAVWVIPAGIIGAKLYHVLTSLPEKGLVDVFKIHEPGLGIPGGIALGFLAGVWAARRRGLDVAKLTHAVIPTLCIGQAVGRLGNYFNQELFGKPTDLPWAVEIDPEVRLGLAAISSDFEPYLNNETFHPTFAYEALWSLGLFAALVIADKKGLLRRWQMPCVYLAGYGLGRFLMENLRVDEAAYLFGVRFNLLLSVAAVVVGAGLWFRFRNEPIMTTAKGSEPD